MPMYKKQSYELRSARARKKARTYMAEKDGSLLVDILNSKDTPERGRKFVEGFVRQLQSLSHDELMRAVPCLNYELRRFPLVLSLTATPVGPFLAVCPKKTAEGWKSIFARSSEKRARGKPPRMPVDTPTLALIAVAGLTEGFSLGRVRECPCGKWFFARFSHQVACSTECYRFKYYKSEAQKKRRADYMRSYRAEERRRNALAAHRAMSDRKDRP